MRLADEVFVVAILRAGLGLVDGFLRLVPEARVGHLGMYRDEEALRPVGYYENIPSGVEDAEVFVVDPMLATGGSGVQAVARLKRAGAQRLHFVCLVAAPEGVARAARGAPGRLDHDRHDRPGTGRNRLHPPWPGRRRGPHLRHRPLRFVQRGQTGMVRGSAPRSRRDFLMAYMQCPECKLTVPATATYLRGDQCPRCLTTMEPRDRFRVAGRRRATPERPMPPAAAPPA